MHTIELDEVVLDRFHKSAVLNPHGVNASSDGLSLAPEEDYGNRDAEDDLDDQKGTESPTEVDVCVEQIGNLGTSECRGDDGSRVQSKQDHSVPKTRNVGQDDGDDVSQSQMTDPVEGVGCGVHFDVVGGGLHDHADGYKEEHEEETFDAAPDVDDLGNGQVANASHDGSDNAGGGQETVLAEGRGDVGDETALD